MKNSMGASLLWDYSHFALKVTLICITHHNLSILFIGPGIIYIECGPKTSFHIICKFKHKTRITPVPIQSHFYSAAHTMKYYESEKCTTFHVIVKTWKQRQCIYLFVLCPYTSAANFTKQIVFIDLLSVVCTDTLHYYTIRTHTRAVPDPLFIFIAHWNGQRKKNNQMLEAKKNMKCVKPVGSCQAHWSVSFFLFTIGSMHVILRIRFFKSRMLIWHTF